MNITRYLRIDVYFDDGSGNESQFMAVEPYV